MERLHEDHRRRRQGGTSSISAIGQRLQTPSLTSHTSTTSNTSSMLSTTSRGGATDSAVDSTTVVAGHSTPPLIDLEDGDGGNLYGHRIDRKRSPLALDAGAGVTPTDKLRALLRQMDGEVHAVLPKRPEDASTTPAGALAPPATLRRSQAISEPVPTVALEEDEEEEYSPPTPPPRIHNPYLYSRRPVERRDVEERKSRSPSPPPRLPSRAIALRAAAEAAASNRSENSAQQRDFRPSALETFIASRPDPLPKASTSRSGVEMTPRPLSPTRKGKERAQNSLNYDDRSFSSRRRRPQSDSLNEEDDPPSPPRRRGLTPRRVVVEAPPDTSAAFAAGLAEADEEIDLEDDSWVPWQEGDETVDSVDSGNGRRQPFMTAEGRSHSRSQGGLSRVDSTMATLATAPSQRTAHATSNGPDTSLPPLPGPESSDEEAESPADRRRTMMDRYSREISPSTGGDIYIDTETSRPLQQSERDSSPSRYDSVRDSARFESLRSSTRSETPSFNTARSAAGVSARDLRRSQDNASLRESRERSLRDIAHEELVRDDTSHRSDVAKPAAPESPRNVASRTSLRRSTSPLLDRQVLSNSSAPDADEGNTDVRNGQARSLRGSSSRRNLRETFGQSASLSHSTPDRSNVRWSPDVEEREGEDGLENSQIDEESSKPEGRHQSSPPRALRASGTGQRSFAETPNRQRMAPKADRAQASELSREIPPAPQSRNASQAETSAALPVSSFGTPPANKRRHADMDPTTPASQLPATPHHLKGMATPRPPGAWGTPIPKASNAAPSTPKAEPSPTDLAGVPTPHPPGAWRNQSAPASGPPSTPGNVTASGTVSSLPTPRPPGSWYTPNAYQRSVPARFSSLRNEVHFDSSVSSNGSSADVSIHRLRTSPKRSPQNQPDVPKTATRPDPLSPTIDRGPKLLAPVIRSPKRSSAWSPSSPRRVSSPAPSTPTRSAARAADDSFDPDTSWAARIQRIVMSPVRRPPPSTALVDAQHALDEASRASTAARTRVEDAQRAWLEALAAVPPEMATSTTVVTQVARKGYSWGVFVAWALLEVVLLWGVFRYVILMKTFTDRQRDSRLRYVSPHSGYGRSLASSAGELRPQRATSCFTSGFRHPASNACKSFRSARHARVL